MQLKELNQNAGSKNLSNSPKKQLELGSTKKPNAS